jgi:hypothetical protein
MKMTELKTAHRFRNLMESQGIPEGNMGNPFLTNVRDAS